MTTDTTNDPLSFADDLPGMWEKADLIGGETDREVIVPDEIIMPGDVTENELVTYHVLDEVFHERQRQDSKFGRQEHPWATPGESPMETWFHYDFIHDQADAKALVERAFEHGHGSYSDILMEEVVEALDEPDLAKVREELIQVAAVAVACVESIDRNGR